jgi:nitric oxide reductase large subunit
LTASDIHDRQNMWQSMGGMEVGSIWGSLERQAALRARLTTW